MLNPFWLESFFLKFLLTMSDCKMLVWEYQLVAQCLQMTSAQNLVNSLSASPPQLPLDREDLLETCSVSCSGLQTCSVSPFASLRRAACVWQSWVQLCVCLFTPLLSVCACLKGLWCCTVCAVLSATRASLGSQTQPPT